MTTLLSLLVLAQGSGQGDIPDKGPGILIIVGVVLLVILVIGAVWTFAARRGSRVPREEPHRRGHAGRVD